MILAAKRLIYNAYSTHSIPHHHLPIPKPIPNTKPSPKMLILIPGITGNIGQHLVASLKSRGHQVRGAGREASKLAKLHHAKPESFIEIKTNHDTSALDKACHGVDGIICAYTGTPEMLLDAQLLLLRAAERAGLRKFVAASWNYDWQKLELGEHEGYDASISFRNHVELTSSIKPIYIFTEVLAEVLFSVPGHGDFSPRNNGVWDPEEKSMEVWGSGEETWHWTTERDAAEFAAEIVSKEGAEGGGFWSLCSGENTLEQIANVYERVKGRKVRVHKRGSVEALAERALRTRSERDRRRFYEYIGWFYRLFTVNRRWVLEGLDNHRLSTKVTTLEEFLESSASI
jgi:nucleoside-diphosphate-sugar epimerase